jgi:hypothetical protein
MITRFVLILVVAFSLPQALVAQTIERISFDQPDSTTGYYLVIKPQSKKIKGVVLLLTSFVTPENLLTETKLHSVAFTNDLLTVVAPMKGKLYADRMAIDRINGLVNEIQKLYKIDNSKFALGGYGEAGNIALRYTELSYEHPHNFPLQPKAVFGIDTAVDLFGLWHWSERQVKKNFWPGAVGDAKYYLETMTRENGSIYNQAETYKALTPFYKADDTAGNEKYLRNVAVRLYYDSDIAWHLNNRRNSLYDTKMPDGSELINRLLLSGNSRAEFIASKKEGRRNDGTRHTSTVSIVDEVDCIQWIKKNMGIFEVHSWTPPYVLKAPKGWGLEQFALPPDFASAMTFKGVEDVRFAPGWGEQASEEYWSYSYLWWIDGKPGISAGSLQENLRTYYSGLVSENVKERNIAGSKMVPTVVSLSKIKSAEGDVQTFSGTIRMLDYMTQSPVVLNIIVHVKDCGALNQTAVFIEISPQHFKHAIWNQMDKINASFTCE